MSGEFLRLGEAMAQMQAARMYDRSNVTIGTSPAVQKVLDAWAAYVSTGHLDPVAAERAAVVAWLLKTWGPEVALGIREGQHLVPAVRS